MKIHILTVVTALFVSSVLASENIALPQINVIGSAVREVMPDKQVWRLDISNVGQVLADAADEHVEIVKTATALLKEQFIRPDNILTSRMHLRQVVPKPNSRVVGGYSALTYITFTLHDFGRYRSIWEELAKHKNIRVINTAYDHSERTQLTIDVKTEALLAARQKAVDLAKAVDSHIAEPLLVEELLPVTVDTANRDFNDLFAWEEDSSAHPGFISIRARVKASFRLVRHN